MQKGWNAKGLLTPVYKKVGGRDTLAAKSGVSVAHLSGVNSGNRNLGILTARKIADAVEGVSVLDLGAPKETADEKDVLLLTEIRDRLVELEEMVAELTATMTQPRRNAA